MSDRIDHAVKAREALEILAGIWGEDLAVDEALARAQVNATLAIVEQLRIGNLIALGGYGDSEAGTDQARSDARVALVEWHAH